MAYSRIKVDIDGLDDLIRKLAEVDKQLDKLREMLDELSNARREIQVKLNQPSAEAND